MSNAVPRDFRLLEEAEVSQKLSKDAGFSYGLEDDEGLSMANWTGTITGILGTPYENYTYKLKMYCGERYPDEPPTIQFISRINISCFDPNNGVVDPRLVPMLARWNRDYTLNSCIQELRRIMTFKDNLGRAQPAAGSTYP